MNDPQYVIIHHSLTPDSKTVSWEAIRRYHVETLGWNDIGYHWGIERVDDVFKVFAGRPELKIGAHCKGMNDKSIGICCVGNYDLRPPPIWMIKELINLVIAILTRYNIPVENVRGHHDYASYKTCPGLLFDMPALRESLYGQRI